MNAPDRIMRMKKVGRSDATHNTRHLTVPARIAALVPDETDFVVELTPDGILYRVVSAPAMDVPDWVANGVDRPTEPEGQA